MYSNQGNSMWFLVYADKDDDPYVYEAIDNDYRYIKLMSWKKFLEYRKKLIII